jgi:L-asparagine transporter-like permease
MLASMFGLGRMMRSLADEKQAPVWLKDKKDVPYRGILFSGGAMLTGLAVGMLLPRVYLFLISSGGFALLFTYVVILATHIRFRKKHGCPPKGNCQMPWYPYSAWAVMICMVLIIASMPFISGQTSGLIAGISMVFLYTGWYFIGTRFLARRIRKGMNGSPQYRFSTEYGKELSDKPRKQKKE